MERGQREIERRVGGTVGGEKRKKDEKREGLKGFRRYNLWE